MLSRVWLSLGSNIGDRLHYLRFALQKLNAHNQIKICNISSLYQTAAWSDSTQEDYYNAVLEIQTDLHPAQLLAYTQYIENKTGRKRHVRWASRELDIDIIVFNRIVINTPDICIPHPRIAERMFVLQPLWEVAGNINVPNNGPLADLIDACDKSQRIEKLFSPGQWEGEAIHGDCQNFGQYE